MTYPRFSKWINVTWFADLFGQGTRDGHLETITRTVVDGIILIDGAGRILVFNPACERLFGYSADEVAGRNVSMLMPHHHGDNHDTYLNAYQRTRQPRIIGKGRTLEGRRKDGSTFPMDLSVGESREDGRPVYVGVIRDLTERRRMIHKHELGKATRKAIIDTVANSVVLADAKGTIHMVNPAFEKLFGYTAEDITGCNVSILMPEAERVQHDGYLARFKAMDRRRVIGVGREVQGRRKDGTTFPIEIAVSDFTRDGKTFLVAAIHDLTTRKSSESKLAQAQKMEAIGQIAGGMAHDFNNLLTVIQGNLEIARDMAFDDPEREEIFTSIAMASERGSQLTSRLLAFSRRQTLHPVPVDCSTLLKDIGILIQRTLGDDITVQTDFAEGLPPAMADPAQLESAVLNLAVNARDAMPDGGTLTITVSDVSFDEAYQGVNPEIIPGNYIMLAVSDTGTGISDDILDQVFEPFFTTKGVGKGSGLGLSMVYGFVKQSEGHVTVYSEIGRGTTIRLFLPVSGAERWQSSTPRPTAPPTPGKGELVLVVEDDELVAKFVSRCLRRLGYTTEVFSNGPGAIDAIRQGLRPDLMLSDMVMPGGMSGLQAAQEARTLIPDLRILFASGYPRETLVARRRILMDTPLLDKPFCSAALSRMVAEALSKPPCLLPDTTRLKNEPVQD